MMEPLFIYLFFPVSKLPILSGGRDRRSHPLSILHYFLFSGDFPVNACPAWSLGCWWFCLLSSLVGGLSLVMCRVLKPVSIVESLIIVSVSPHCLHKSVDSSAKRKEAREPKMSMA